VDDRERQNRIAQLIEEKSPDILKEDGIFEFLFTRGYGNIEEAADLISSIDPDTVELDQVTGIFQGYYDWDNYFPTTVNPFDHLKDKACAIVSGSLWMDSGKTCVFVLQEDLIHTEFNIRFGKALLGWAESVKSESWAMLARSIILSVLSLETSDTVGFVSAELRIIPEDDTPESIGTSRLSTARIYLILEQGRYRPQAVALGPQANNAWAWTVGLNVSAAMQNNVLDISVNFPAGESHYMIIRGIRPFSHIQFYDMDWRSDPQFERYDSSGWSYIASEQTLLLKVRHRAETEHIRIFY
jgi:hypothetical protein